MSIKGVWLILIAVGLAGCSIAPEAPAGGASAGSTSGVSVNLVSSPGVDELGQVQGFAFLEDSVWMDEGPAEGAWLTSTPSPSQAQAAGVGVLARVEPATCEPVALMAGYGWTAAASDASRVLEVGYAKRRSNSGQAYPTAGSVDTWESISYRMPAGQAGQVVQDLQDAWASCNVFELVDAKGEQRPGERAHNLTPERGWAVDLVRSGNAVLRRASMDGPVGARLVTVLEPIGDVLLVTRIGIWSTEDQVWQRASDLYNDLADQVVAGADRAPVDLSAR